MITRIYELAQLNGLSRGELLLLAREVAACDTDLRTIDLLTGQERLQLIACLESMACEPICV